MRSEKFRRIQDIPKEINENFKIVLSGPEFEDVNYSELIKFIKNSGFHTVREEDLLLKIDPDLFAEKMAKIRVLVPDKKKLNENPFPLEIEYEKNNLKRKKRKKGIIYSGNHFLKTLKEELDEILDLRKKWIIYFSDQLLATFNGRWHIRVIILGVPVIISVPGIIYGPARSREYYISAGIGVPETGEDYVREKDERKTEILKGYLLQAIYFYICLLKGKKFMFCEDKNCALFNSHWQREILTAQMNHKLCKIHSREFII